MKHYKILKKIIIKIYFTITTKYFRDNIKLLFINFNKRPPILVFQMGKVASNSILNTLKNKNLEYTLFKSHYLSKEGLRFARKWHKQHEGKIPYAVKYAGLLRKKILRWNKKNKLKIITISREPIGREISSYFELAQRIDHGLKDRDKNKFAVNVMKYIIYKLDEIDNEDNFFITKWFNRELRTTFSVDIYEYPFDYEKGYTIINNNNIEVLLLKYEKLDTTFNDAINEFFHINEKIDLQKFNIGRNKWYSEIYSKVKRNINIPQNICNKVYNIRYVKYFYTNDEIKYFLKKWSNKN